MLLCRHLPFLWGVSRREGNISTIWPMFGVSNQLLAAIALGLGATLLIKSGKLRYAWTTFIPMVFMYTTTFAASWELTGIFLAKAANAATSGAVFNFKMNAGLVAIMALLAVISLLDMLYKWYGYITESRRIVTSEVLEYQDTT